MCHTITLLVSNIHCPSCVTHVQEILSHIIPPEKYEVSVSILNHSVRVRSLEQQPIATIHSNSDRIAAELARAAFQIDHVEVADGTGNVVRSIDKTKKISVVDTILSATPILNRRQKKHLDNCIACQEDAQEKSSSKGWLKAVKPLRKWGQHVLDEIQSEVDLEKGTNKSQTHAATSNTAQLKDGSMIRSITFSVEGMTCASCVSSITQAVEEVSEVLTVQVSLLSNSVKVTYRDGPSKIEEVLHAIDNAGFNAIIEQQSSPSMSESTDARIKAIISIDGMTCSSCTSAITEGVKILSFVHDIQVSLVSNSATVVFDDESNVDKILESITDLGYEAVVTEISKLGCNELAPTTQTRTVEIEVKGMYCSNCPDRIKEAVREEFGEQFILEHHVNPDASRITVTYTPLAPLVTVRALVDFINSVNPAYRVSIYHPPSIEERSRQLQRKERNRILRHLFLTFLAAIPSFIIGIVYMSLVPANNSTRLWLEMPIWAGAAMRMEWILFIITTPVMFYGANLFHIRAIKEIWSIWRPRSRVPFLRRFYRFGSMNLLLSLGTSVAYFASLAVLIMDATDSASGMDTSHHNASSSTRKSTTYFDTVTFLTLFILGGKFLEAYSKAKTGDAVSALIDLRPKFATLIESDQAITGSAGASKQVQKTIPIDLLEIGDLVSVPHGASPPVDGVIGQEGIFLFDESSLTGESKPVRKFKGDKVYSGTVNISDPVRINVTELRGKSMLDQIVEVVREGQAKRAPIERFADTLTAYFTPVITLLSIMTWIIWSALGQSGALPESWLDVRKGGWSFWSLEFAIAVFVVACPCGIGLAAPTAFFAGVGLAARQGILIKGGGEAFQEASRLDAVVFDKTGTLTEGKMEVVKIEEVDHMSEDELQIALSIAKEMETACTHPIADAIVKACNSRLEGLSPQIDTFGVDLKEQSGLGMSGTFRIVSHATSKTKIYDAIIGNEKLFKAADNVEWQSQKSGKDGCQNTSTPVSTKLDLISPMLRKFQTSGHSTAILAVRERADDKQPSGQFNPILVFAITDPLRSDASTVISTLQSRGIQAYMCTGDNNTTALTIASQLGIPASHVRSNALPQDKAAFIRSLQFPDSINSSETSTKTDLKGKRRTVAFVGDGTNDTPALAAADVSIAISHHHHQQQHQQQHDSASSLSSSSSPSSSLTASNTNNNYGDKAKGSDIAMQSASFILLTADLTTIPQLVSLSTRVFHRVRINFAWALVYNVVLIPVAAGILFPVGADRQHGGWRLSPVWAAAAMAGSSVSVVCSSLALRLPEIKFENMFGKKKMKKQKFPKKIFH